MNPKSGNSNRVSTPSRMESENEVEDMDEGESGLSEDDDDNEREEDRDEAANDSSDDADDPDEEEDSSGKLQLTKINQ